MKAISLMFFMALILSLTNCIIFANNKKNNKDFCTTTLDNIIKHNWVIYNKLTYNFEPNYTRNDKLSNLLLNEYNHCLVGVKKDEIIKKFGKPTNSDSISLIYSCYSKDSREIYCLRFWLSRDDIIQRITYDQCMAEID